MLQQSLDIDTAVELLHEQASVKHINCYLLSEACSGVAGSSRCQLEQSSSSM